MYVSPLLFYFLYFLLRHSFSKRVIFSEATPSSLGDHVDDEIVMRSLLVRIPRLFLSRSIVLPPAWVVKRTLIERPPFQTCVSSLLVIYCFLHVPLCAYLLAATSEAADFAKSATCVQTKASWHLSPMMTSVALLWKRRALNVLSSPSAWGRQRWRLYKFTSVQHSYLESPADLARLLRKVKGRLGRRASLWLHNQLGQE